MRFSEIRELVQFKPLEPRSVARLNACLTVDDVRALARHHLPSMVFDYVDGGADEELTMAENRAAFRQWRFAPRVLQDVSGVSTAAGLFGRCYGAPLALCPTGYTRMMHPAGEGAVADAASMYNVPYALSTSGTTSIEDLVAGRAGELWFQLYILRDRGLARSLVERAHMASYRVLEVTVDTPVAGRRIRDVRNGLTVPPTLRARALADIAMHVGYWTDMLRAPALRFANLGRPEVGEDRVSPTNMANLFDPTVTWDDIAEVRSWWPGPMLLKGPLGPEDAKRARSLGVDGVHLSNHGGRQLDRSVPTVELVGPVRQALGDDIAIVVDSGFRHGSDIAVAIALGADLCAVGRPYLYGLAAAGERGVAKVLEILIDQLRRTMQLAGVISVDGLRQYGPELLTRRNNGD